MPVVFSFYYLLSNDKGKKTFDSGKFFFYINIKFMKELIGVNVDKLLKKKTQNIILNVFNH